MRVIGVDENGLGPWLGPLVCTAATIEVSAYDARQWTQRAERLGIRDSKQSSSFGHMARAEGLALALAERERGEQVTRMEALLETIALESPDVLRSICPGGEAQAACWGPALRLPAFGGEAAEGERTLRAFEAHGARVIGCRTSPLCAKALNQNRTAGRNKLMMDLHGFERLVLASADGAEDVLAVCGLVGGIRAYGPRFAHFQGARTLAESRGLAAYAVPGLGEVRFELSADARHMPVGLASMVGKYMRELFMARSNRHWKERVPALRPASGYHDKVTKALVQATEAARREGDVPDECFFR